MNRKRLTTLLLSATLLVTNTLPVQAEITVIDAADAAQEMVTLSDNHLWEEATDDRSLSVTDFQNGYVGDGISHGFPKNGLNQASYESLDQDGLSAEREVAYPSKYDPRPYGVSGIRSQVLGSCWLYSALAAVESNLIKKGYADRTIDLSEFQLLYFMDRGFKDPLGNFTNDFKLSQTPPTMKESLESGGIQEAAISFLSLWCGPVLESQAPMNDDVADREAYYAYLDTVVLGEEFAANSGKWHFRASKACDYDSDHLDNVKELITAYGGVTMSFYNDGYYYDCAGNGQDASYRYPFNPSSHGVTANHAVEIVGWDDNYSRNNFYSRPRADGAWLVKDSSGEFGVGNYTTTGYFWISYYDKSICDIIAVEYDDKSRYANLYAYDGCAGTGRHGKISGKTALNIYTAKAYGGDSVEKVDGVMTYLAPDTSYELTVYLNPVIENGKLVGYSGKSEPVMGTSDYEGFYTIDLKDQEIYVPDGSTYGICITTDKVSSVFVGGHYQETGQAYSGDDLDTLVDLGGVIPEGESYLDYSYRAPCLRGLTNRVENIVLSTDIKLNKDRISLKEGESTAVTVSEFLPENATNKTCGYRSTDESVAIVDEEGKVTVTGYGECDIIATAYDGLSSDSCHVTVYCSGFSLTNAKLLCGETKRIALSFNRYFSGIGAQQLTWVSSDPDVAAVDATGNVTAKSAGTATITASLADEKLTGGRELTAVCTVTVEKPAQKPEPTPPAEEDPKESEKESEKAGIQAGVVYKTSRGSYFTGDARSGEVCYFRAPKGAAGAFKIPDTVTLKGKKYKVTSIASSAFKNNKKLTKVVIGKNITAIGSKAFYGCKKLKTITIKSTKLKKKTVGMKAFQGIHKKAVIKVPKKERAAYKKILKGKTDKTTVIK